MNKIEMSYTTGEMGTVDTAPDVSCVTTDVQKIIIVRLRCGTDVLEGLQNVVKENAINNAVILMGIGSLTGYHVHMVDNTTFPHEEVYIKEQGPFDLLNLNGYIINGRVHAHISIADGNKATGGHLEPGTTIFTFVAVTIGMIDDNADIARLDDFRYR
ncbi:PPC domain-containing DNA-binding protein [Planctomycetota bacterium]